MEQNQTEHQYLYDDQYESYLLRLWQTSPGRGRRAMLQDVLTSERHNFASLESLFAFLGKIEMGDGEEGGES